MIKVIFWDFDGVLMDSNSVRDLGFENVLAKFPKEEVQKLMEFHQANGGLSRYVKFRHFFEHIRGETITEDEVLVWATRFSAIMIELLVNPNLLIHETLDFVIKNQGKYQMHITSGSDQEELKFLCKEMNINQYFDSIHGSPKPKKQWIKELIKTHAYKPDECVLIGDSLNDWEAALTNNIYFCPYSSKVLNDFLK